MGRRHTSPLELKATYRSSERSKVASFDTLTKVLDFVPLHLRCHRVSLVGRLGPRGSFVYFSFAERVPHLVHFFMDEPVSSPVEYENGNQSRVPHHHEHPHLECILQAHVRCTGCRAPHDLECIVNRYSSPSREEPPRTRHRGSGPVMDGRGRAGEIQTGVFFI